MMGLVVAAFMSLVGPPPAGPLFYALTPKLPELPLPRGVDVGNRKARRRFKSVGW